MRFALPLLAALLLAGCMSPESRVIGKWTGELQLSDTAKTLGGSTAKGVAGFLDPQVDLRPDKTFTLYMGPMPIEGNWRFDANGKDILLDVKSYMGLNPGEVKKKADEGMARIGGPLSFLPGLPVDPAKPMRLRISDDWKTLSLEPLGEGTADGFGDLVFKKV